MFDKRIGCGKVKTKEEGVQVQGLATCVLLVLDEVGIPPT